MYNKKYTLKNIKYKDKEKIENIENRLNSLFFQEKAVKAFLKLLEKTPSYASIVAKEIDCTYAHTFKILNIFQRLGLVKFNREGRIKLVELTQKGKELAEIFKKSFELLEKLKTHREEIRARKILKPAKSFSRKDFQRYRSQLKRLYYKVRSKKLSREQVPASLRWLKGIKTTVSSSEIKRKTSLLKLIKEINKELKEQTID